MDRGVCRLQFMGSQRVGHNIATKTNNNSCKKLKCTWKLSYSFLNPGVLSLYQSAGLIFWNNLEMIMFLSRHLKCTKRQRQSTRSVVSDSLRPCGLQPTRLLHPWDSPGKSSGVGCHFLLQEIFPTQGSKPGSPALQADALPY